MLNDLEKIAIDELIKRRNKLLNRGQIKVVKKTQGTIERLREKLVAKK